MRVWALNERPELDVAEVAEKFIAYALEKGIPDDLDAAWRSWVRKELPPDDGEWTECPDDFQLTADMRAWARRHAPAVDVDVQTAQFVDGAIEQGRLSRSWVQVWRGQMLAQQKAKEGRGWLTHPISSQHR